MHHSKTDNQFSTVSDFICYFYAFTEYFELWDPEIEKHFKWTLKRLKGCMVSSFHPHSMCKKVGRVTTKIRCTSCTKWTISFEVSGFHTETRVFQRDFIFLILFAPPCFLCSKCTIQSHIIIFQSFLTYSLFFMHLLLILSYKTLKLKNISNELWNDWKVAWYHHFTHIACAKK